MFNYLMVDAYGSKIPLPEAGQSVMKGANKLQISVFDPDLVSPTAKSIRDCGMWLNPTTEANAVIVTIPKPSKEARESVVKLAAKTAEKVKLPYRFILSNFTRHLFADKARYPQHQTRCYGCTKES